MLCRLFFLCVLLPLEAYCSDEQTKYLVFIGKKETLRHVPPTEDQIAFDSEFLATYEVLDVVRGNYNPNSITFRVFDHYGTPEFSQYEHVMLYVIQHEDEYYHSKYQYHPLYKTKTGEWAGPYSTYDYDHSYNKDTKIKPEIIEFTEPVVIDVSEYEEADIKTWFPEPYYRIEGDKAIAVYGNYVKDLFFLKQNGVLKARGEFQ